MEGKGGKGREGEGKGHEPSPHYLQEVYAYDVKYINDEWMVDHNLICF